jgi:hypothetical protein
VTNPGIFSQGPAALKYGVSITDACVDWQMTVEMLDRLDEVRPGFPIDALIIFAYSMFHRLSSIGALLSSKLVSRNPRRLPT